jgi:GNAT superfamily N-acetyltransferase
MVEGKHDAVVLYRNDFINIEIDNDSMGFSQMRILEIDDAGKLILNNELFKIAPEYQGMGYGTKALFHQVKEAKKAGISYIQTFAAREDGYNGYYTWAQLGYDCDLENIGGHIQQTVKKAVTKGELPEGKYETVQDIMKANGGPEWWKKNGVGFPGDINLEKEGATDRIEAYVKAQADHIGVSVDEWLDMPGEEIVKRKKAKKVEARLIRLAYLYPSLSSLVQS